LHAGVEAVRKPAFELESERRSTTTPESIAGRDHARSLRRNALIVDEGSVDQQNRVCIASKFARVSFQIRE
jgi:hypothetical protein